jgi:regulator of protease activity HflC (stomatin/prohibitin superfamily)
MFFSKPKNAIQIYPNTKGYLYKNLKFEKELEPGVHEIKLEKEKDFHIILSLLNNFTNVTNQEVLTKDNISLRFSYFINFRITDGLKVLDNFDVSCGSASVAAEIQNKLHFFSQVYFRNTISEIESEELNLKRKDIEEKVLELMKEETLKIGVTVLAVMVRDISFPKNIQDILAKQLETKIRSKIDLENARTQVAAARALKNASEMMKDNENIKFLQVLEAITKIADKGKHTFIFGEPMDIIKKH